MITQTLKQHNLKTKEFYEFAELSKTQFNYAIKKADPIYMKGLEDKLKEFIKWKIERLKTI